MRISGDKFYADEYWRTTDYFAYGMWSGPPTGTVDVGPVQATQDAEKTP